MSLPQEAVALFLSSTAAFDLPNLSSHQQCLLLLHMEVPWPGVTSEQLPAYTTATAMQDPSPICDLHHSSQQPWILTPLNKARDGTRILMDASFITRCTTMGTPSFGFLTAHFLHNVVNQLYLNKKK